MNDKDDNKSKKSWRDPEILDKLLNNPTVDSIMNDTSHPCWCSNCGNAQGVNHLGSQACVKCGKRNWIDKASFEKCNKAWQKEREETIGKR